jgi:hypothetical protein
MKAEVVSPLRKAVFYVVESGVDEDSSVVPRTRLDADSLMYQTVLREIPIRDSNGYRVASGSVTKTKL